MPFITNYNFSKIIKDIDIRDTVEGDVYKKPIYFLNNNEKTKLLKIRMLLQLHHQDLVKYYTKVEKKEDTQSWIFEGGTPAYHQIPDCSTLSSEYINFPIPEEIKGNNTVKDFRLWFKENMHLIADGKEDIFKLHLLTKFGVQLQSKIQIPNSGKKILDNLELTELERRIDAILSEASSFFGSASSREKDAIKKYSKRAFLHNSKYAINDNDTGLSEKELRGFLFTYDTKFKTPMKDLLQQFYMVKYNPTLEFKGSLLEQLGFKKCTKCYNQPRITKSNQVGDISIEPLSQPNSIGDSSDIWFRSVVVGDGEFGTIVGHEYWYLECLRDTTSASGKSYRKGNWFLIPKS